MGESAFSPGQILSVAGRSSTFESTLQEPTALQIARMVFLYLLEVARTLGSLCLQVTWMSLNSVCLLTHVP